MLAELAAANAAFAVIKTAISNGKEIADVAHKVSDYVNATEDLRKKGEKKRRKGYRTSDLEEFMHLEKLKRQEEQLKELMIWTGRPGLWHDWQKFQANARKERLAEKERKRKQAQFIAKIVIWVVGSIGLASGIVVLWYWIEFLKGLE